MLEHAHGNFSSRRVNKFWKNLASHRRDSNHGAIKRHTHVTPAFLINHKLVHTRLPVRLLVNPIVLTGIWLVLLKQLKLHFDFLVITNICTCFVLQSYGYWCLYRFWYTTSFLNICKTVSFPSVNTFLPSNSWPRSRV